MKISIFFTRCYDESLENSLKHFLRQNQLSRLLIKLNKQTQSVLLFKLNNLMMHRTIPINMIHNLCANFQYLK
jgi:hypothetical protein